MYHILIKQDYDVVSDNHKQGQSEPQAPVTYVKHMLLQLTILIAHV